MKITTLNNWPEEEYKAAVTAFLCGHNKSNNSQLQVMLHVYIYIQPIANTIILYYSSTSSRL